MDEAIKIFVAVAIAAVVGVVLFAIVGNAGTAGTVMNQISTAITGFITTITGSVHP